MKRIELAPQQKNLQNSNDFGGFRFVKWITANLKSFNFY